MKFLSGYTMKTGLESQKLLLLCWDIVCSPKEMGGLGLTSLYHKNLSLLLKRQWSCIKDRDKIWNRVLNEKYGRNVLDFAQVTLDNSSSPILQCIQKARTTSAVRHLIHKNFKWVIRDGTSALFWEDLGIKDSTLNEKFRRLYSLSKLKWCSIHSYKYQWIASRDDFKFVRHAH